jgi:DNA-binding GntR family transcriptional regulator
VAAEYLRQLIYDGTLEPGSRVPQDRIAQALGMSRIPVREALAMLATEGRVNIVLNRGAYVSSFDERSVLEAMELNRLMMRFFIYRAVEHATPEFTAEAASIATRIKKAKGADEIDEARHELIDLIFRTGAAARVYAALRLFRTLGPAHFLHAFPQLVPLEKRRYTAMAVALAAGDADAGWAAFESTLDETHAVVIRTLKERRVVTDGSD